MCDFFRTIGESYPVLHSYLVIFAIAIPLIMALSLAVSGKLPASVVKVSGILGFLVPGLISLWLAGVYLSSGYNGLYAFPVIADLGLEQFGIRLHLGLNGLALPFYVLSGIVGLAAGLYAVQSGVERLRLMLILLLIMQAGLMGVFSSVDILFFYFFHEFALIPTFVMIAIWGRSGRRAVALEVTIYLTLGAMITLAGLIALYIFSGASDFNMIALRDAVVAAPRQGTIFGLLLIGFGVLVSLFPFHTWAPRAYATAPAPAAMLHAGVLKKFGLYGLIQIAYPILPQGVADWAPLLLILALGNVLIIGFVTMAQRDLKLMLGNASVMHMGYAFLGLYAYSSIGIGAAVLMLFAHGLSVALLFLLADVVEKRGGTCDMEEIGGLGQKAPVLMSLFVAAMLASIGLPGFANFWGELGIFVSLFATATPWALYLALIGILISAIYGLRAIASVFFGEEKGELSGGDISWREKIPALLLLAFLLLIGIWPKLLSDPVNESVTRTFADSAPTMVVPSGEFSLTK
ncbi:NADH-quinone oxidoreductase subunit M [Puniceicoccales bacterium CK1056]|uniref:NADH-quinone oxidoreductase subunit M n=2 Tax=Oceanipulchritudo coccoides TaxID=2706888 RepID=A0A6B2M2T5_9BACT|nr:NADH-quinone oxidoreductase subunit M [Oceanipulchritudo coccoides]